MSEWMVNDDWFAVEWASEQRSVNVCLSRRSKRFLPIQKLIIGLFPCHVQKVDRLHAELIRFILN